jgi:hypothetical protein
LPTQPSGSSAPRTTRRRESSRASRSRIAGVASTERSSTTITSKSIHRCAKSERTQRSIERSSSRAGTRIETRGKRFGGRAGSKGNSAQLAANDATRVT